MRPEVLQKRMESEYISKYTAIWNVCTGGKFSVKISGKIGINFWKFSAGTFRTQP